ncbi:hypothetical protein AYO44_00585 [Planctomycetaceae bacterium SCGC AG-212-F19]|nr:hypothetical protein AYO44_00585 [Planctomycetaceae bacterium SCGC AG-212-F19]
MRSAWQSWWRVGKPLLGLAIIGGVAWRFYDILSRPELWEKPLPFRVGWLIAVVLFYEIGLAFPALFWHWLVASLGEKPHLVATMRAYYFGHLGKYVPGKAWGLLLRTEGMANAGVRPAVGVITTVFETLTTMASGALLAALLFAFLALNWNATWIALGLLAIAGLPVLPGVFNPLMKFFANISERAARKLGRETGMADLPHVQLATLAGGLGITALGWLVMGLSLWAALQALLPEPLAWDVALWGRCTAYVALAWVAGFLAVVTPGGLGIREFVFERLLTPDIRQAAPGSDAEGLAVIVALVLRLLWTAGDIIMVGVVYWLPATGSNLPAAPPAAPPSTDPGPAP